MGDPEQLRSRDFLRAQCVGEICSQAPLDFESSHCSEYVCCDTKELLEIAKILTVHHTTNGARLLCCQKIVGGFCLRFQLLRARFRHRQRFFVTSKDPIESHLGIREAFYAQRWDLVLQTAVDGNNEVREEEC